MKHRFLYIMALLLTVATGAWAQDPDPNDLTPSADRTVWTLSTMPEYDVELEVTYYTDAELNQMAADEVIDKITAIGTVTYTPESKALIDAARTAYDALTADQQALVTNYSTLTDAETTYATAEETAYTEGVELTKNPDGTWSLAATPAFDVELEIEYYATTPFDLTVGESLHGTVAFSVGGETVNKACYDDVVTVSVTPNEGYSLKGVTAQTSSQEAVSMSNGENGWTFNMPEDKVTVTVTYTKNLQDTWIQAIADQTWTGSAIEPTIEVKDGEAMLVLNTDYTVAYSNNVETGTATVTVTGTGNYSGTATANFTIVADKSALNTAITEADTYYNSIKDDHAEAAAALKTAIDNAKTMQEKDDATQDDVNNALSTLTTAKTTAEDAVLTETKSALNTAITEAEDYYNSISESNPDAAATLLTAINDAKDVKAKSDATQSEVDAAIAALARATDAAYEAQGLKRITLTEQYGTYCLDKDLDFSETTGLTAYIAAGYNKTEGSLLMVKVTSVPAGTGLLLKRDSEASGTFTAKMITSSPYIYSNLLTGTTKETDVTTNDLILSKDDKGTIGFYRVKADGKIAANKAYLKGLAPATSAPRLTLEFLDDATDIAAITSKPADANRNSWYTLDGRKLQGAPAKKGIYLLNGKKVVVR